MPLTFNPAPIELLATETVLKAMVENLIVAVAAVCTSNAAPTAVAELPENVLLVIVTASLAAAATATAPPFAAELAANVD